MAALRLGRTGFRLLFIPYALGLSIWLLLGVLPTLAADVPAVHHLVASLAPHHAFAARVLHPQMPGSMGPDMTTTLQAVLQYAFSLVNLGLGVFLAVRLPDQRVPRLLAFALLGTAATFNLPSHRAFHITGTPLPITLIHFTFHIVSGTCYIWAVALFADGTLPPRLRLGPRAMPAAVVAVTAVVAFICWRSSFLAHPQFFVVFFGVIVSLVGVGVQSLRLADPSTTPTQRRTARLLIAALLPALATAALWLGSRAAAALGFATATHVAVAAQTLFPAVFAIVPLVLFAGVVRYRLWDVDRLLSRVLTYGVIAVLIGSGYVAAVAISSRLAGGQLLWTVLLLAVVATAVEPLRLVARRWANRVVFGQEISPTEAMRSLVSGLEQLSPTGELDRLTEVAVRATRAREAAVWVLDADRLRAASIRPDRSADDVGVPTGPPETWTEALDATRCWPVTHQGELLGVLAVGSDGGLPSTDGDLLADLAAHAGLLVHNALLTIHLARQVADLAAGAAELQSSRRWLVEAQDAERRRLERNLHDGAQQALVAAIAGIGAITATDATGSSRADQIGELREVLSTARASVLELCGDGRPAALSAYGLAGALKRSGGLSRQAGLAVTVQVSGDLGTVPPDVETAGYFCCLEALQNTAKYASASQVWITIARLGSDLLLEVRDDGTGIVDGAGSASGGLAQLRSRLSAVGGRLTIASPADGGTVVRAAIPLPVPSQGESTVPAPAEVHA